MSQYIYDFDDDLHERRFKVEIHYDTQEPEWDECERGRYRIPGQICVTCVEVLEVEYYSAVGDCIAHVSRDRLSPDSRKLLDLEAETAVCEMVDDGDLLFDYLWENRE